ncbi:LysR family transcriptional regulator [Undibacterium sp. Ji42W]|uniref:LysR family transcriptional regulator n=1 Tax=Undibacterium sp. Ji42W TaxID=3413039 RepID=UPI003BF212BC
MPDLDLHDLKLIFTIAKEKSLSATAQRLGVTSPAISIRLSKLEDKIGAKLVHRQGGARLTQAGHQVLKLATSVEHGLSQLENDLAEMHLPRLKIIANTSLIIDDVTPVIDKMTQANPGLEVTLTEGTFPDIINAVLNEVADAGLIAGRPKVSGLRLFPYKTERLCLIAPAQHPIAALNEVTFVEAAKHPFIAADKEKQLSLLMKSKAKKNKVTLKFPVKVTSFEAQAHIICNTNIGIALVLGSVAQRFAKTYPIKIVKLSDDWALNEFSVIVRETGTLNDQTLEFVRLLIQTQKAP